MHDRQDDPDVVARMRQISDACRAVVDRLTGNIPHLSLVRFNLRAESIPQRSDGFTLVVDAIHDGWGPTLHSRRLQWRQNLGLAMHTARLIDSGMPDVDVDIKVSGMTAATLPQAFHGVMRGIPIEDIAAAYERTLIFVIYMQRTLARNGAALGYRAPIPRHDDDARMKVGHLRTRIATLDHMIHELGPAGALHTIRETVRCLLRDDQSIRDDDISGPVQMKGSGHMVGVTSHLGEPGYWIVRKIGDPRRPAHYDGLFLTIPLELPETLGIAVSGRTVGEIAPTGIPSLDHAVIQDACPSEYDGTDLELDVPHILVRDHPALRDLLADERPDPITGD